MIGKLLSHILGNMEEDAIIGVNSVQSENGEELLEYDDGEWIIINIHGRSLSSADVDPLENLLIEHPSMSVYKMVSPRTEEEEEEELSSDEDEDGSPRPVPFKRHLSWRLAGWGGPLPSSTSVLPIQCGKTQMDRRKLSRSALQRQNLARIRFTPADRRYGFFKQPCQRLYNY